MSNNAKTVQIYLPDGTTDGLKIATIKTRNIEIIYFSRNNLSKFNEYMKDKKDSCKVGVYLLLGIDENNNEKVYIGETEEIIKRMETHNKEKDFWEKAYFMLSTNDFFTKSHIRYLENFLYAKANEAGIVKLDQNIPTKSHVGESTEADLTGDIFETIQDLLPLLIGKDIFNRIEKKSPTVDKDVFTASDTAGNTGDGKYLDGGFLVFEGAKCRLDLVNSCNSSHRNLRTTLLTNKILEEKDGFLILTKNYSFNSPSSAAGCILGKPSNGWTDWKNKDNKTLADVYRNVSI